MGGGSGPSSITPCSRNPLSLAEPSAWLSCAQCRVKRPAACGGLRTWRSASLRYRLRGRLRAIAADRKEAPHHRSLLSRVVAAKIVPHPCELQVSERAVTTSTDGVDPAEFTQPRWTMLRAWRLESPQ